MTHKPLSIYLRISGWAAIIATFVNFGLTMVRRSQQLAEWDIIGEDRVGVLAVNIVGFSLELPLTLTIACLCLMAARFLTYKQQTIKTVFE